MHDMHIFTENNKFDEVKIKYIVFVLFLIEFMSRRIIIHIYFIYVWHYVLGLYIVSS